MNHGRMRGRREKRKDDSQAERRPQKRARLEVPAHVANAGNAASAASVDRKEALLGNENMVQLSKMEPRVMGIYWKELNQRFFAQ